MRKKTITITQETTAGEIDRHTAVLDPDALTECVELGEFVKAAGWESKPIAHGDTFRVIVEGEDA